MWALDGRQVYFTPGRGLGPELRVLTPRRDDGRGVRQLRRSFATVEDITRDGQYLVLSSNRPQRLSGFNEAAIRVSAAYWSRASSARSKRAYRRTADGSRTPSLYQRGLEVFVQPFDRPGDRIQVSATGGSGAVWRDDGRELYDEGTEGMMAVPLSERNGALEAGMPQKLFALRTQGLVINQPHNVEVAAHGQKFLVNTIVGDSDNVPLESDAQLDDGAEEVSALLGSCETVALLGPGIWARSLVRAMPV